MKLKMIKAITFADMYSSFKSKTLPVMTAYKLSKLFNSIEDIHSFYSLELNKIIDKYALRDAEGNYMPIKEEGKETGVRLHPQHVMDAQKEMNNLMSLEVDVADVKFTLAELEKVELSLEQFELFLPFIEEDKKEDGE